MATAHADRPKTAIKAEVRIWRSPFGKEVPGKSGGSNASRILPPLKRKLRCPHPVSCQSATADGAALIRQLEVSSAWLAGGMPPRGSFLPLPPRTASRQFTAQLPDAPLVPGDPERRDGVARCPLVSAQTCGCILRKRSQADAAPHGRTGENGFTNGVRRSRRAGVSVRVMPPKV